MEWWWLFIIIVGSILLILATGMPVAFAFIIVNLMGVLILQGGGRAFHSLTLSMYSSVSTFTILPVPLFILMGEILWHSRVRFGRSTCSTSCWAGCLAGSASSRCCPAPCSRV